MKNTILLLCCLASFLELNAATFYVTTNADDGPGSLRQGIADANANPGPDLIMFSHVSGTISLTSALPTVSDSLAIQGPGADLLTVSGNGLVRVFELLSGTTNTISALTIADGLAPLNANGGGICNSGTLFIASCKIVNNRTYGGFGGGIYSAGNLGINYSTIWSNHGSRAGRIRRFRTERRRRRRGRIWRRAVHSSGHRRCHKLRVQPKCSSGW